MKSLAEQLERTLAGKVCILGVGNRMRGDDGAGSLLIDKVAARTAAICVDGGTAPENHLEKIARHEPDTVLIVDAVDFSGEPGAMRILTAGDLATSGLSTHALSLEMTCQYLADRCSAHIFLVAIQPVSLGLDQAMNDRVSRAVDALAETLSRLLPRV
jgi:hydrogenase 3 maturation protease